MWKACLVASLAACSSLPEVAGDRCGNGVLEPGEGCEVVPGTPDGGLACTGCQYECSPAAFEPTCPAGWGCGLDGTCRHGVGMLAAGEAVRVDAFDTMQTGNLIADPADELVLLSDQGGDREFVSGAGRELRVDRRPGFGTATAATRDLDRDGYDELVRVAFGGLYAIAGVVGAQTKILPALTSAGFQSNGVPVLTLLERPSSQLPNAAVAVDLLGAFRDETNLHIRVEQPVLNGPTVLADLLPLTFHAPVGDGPGHPLLPIATGHFSSLTSTDAVIAAPGGQVAVVSFSFVLMKGIEHHFRGVAFDGPAGTTIEAIGVADIAVGGNDEIIVQTSNGLFYLNATDMVWVPYSNNGGNALRKCDGINLPGAPERHLSLPLASAQLGGDAGTDLVTREGILLRNPTGSAQPFCIAKLFFPEGRAGTNQVAVVDIDNRAALDVAIVDPGTRSVTLFISKGNDSWSSIPNLGTHDVTALRAGNFDEGIFDDLLIVEDGVDRPGADGPTSQLALLSGTPLDAIGNFEPLLDAPAIQDVVVRPREAEDSSDEIVFAAKVGATYYSGKITSRNHGKILYSDLPTKDAVPVALAFGTARSRDLFAIFEKIDAPKRHSVCRLRDQDGFLFDGFKACLTLSDPLASQLAIARFDGDDSDDVIVGGPAGIVEISGSGDMTSLPEPTVLSTTGATALAAIRRPEGCVAAARAQGVELLCAASHFMVTDAPATAVAAIDLDGDGTDEVAVTTADRLQVFAVGSGAGDEASLLVDLPLAGAPTGPVFLAAGDLDGDGVPDLQVGAHGQVQAFWSTAHDEVGP